MAVAELLNNMKSLYQDASNSLSWSSVAVYAGIFGGTWLLYKALVEPFLSPLRQIPGMTFNPVLGNVRDLMKGEAMEQTLQMIKNHGPIVRYYFPLGQERLMLADPDAIKHVLVTNSKNYIKPPSRMILMKMVFGNGLLLSEGAVHAARKRLMSPAFNNTSIKKMLPIFVKRTQQMSDHWSAAISQSGQTTDAEIHTDLSKTTLDIIGEIAFGYNFNSFGQGRREVSEAFQRMLSGAGFSWRLLIPFYHKLPFPRAFRFKQDLRTMFKTVMDILSHKQELLKQGADESNVTQDVLGKLLLARDEDGQGLTDKEIHDEVMTVMLAGHETTAVGMAWCLLAMAQHPQIQQQAREEAVRILPHDGADITWEHVEQLSYINNVVKETLRLYPPVPMTLRQAVNNDVITGTNSPPYSIPKNTIMLIAIGAMMRRPEVFDKPEEFIPERFEDPKVEGNMYAFLPFLIGSRMCLGYKFAQIEMKVMLALLLRELAFEQIPGTTYERKNRITMRPEPALRLKVSKVSM